MTVKDYLEKLQELVLKSPECLDWEIIYSSDDEGNEYQKVNYAPSKIEIDNIGDNRFLERVYLEDDETPSTNYNAVIIN